MQAAHLVASYEGESSLFNAALTECQNVFDLCIALWGKLGDDGDDDERESGGRRDSHEATMMRREAFSRWLENVVESGVNDDIRKARASGDHVDQVPSHFITHQPFSGTLGIFFIIMAAFADFISYLT